MRRRDRYIAELEGEKDVPANELSDVGAIPGRTWDDCEAGFIEKERMRLGLLVK